MSALIPLSLGFESPEDGRMVKLIERGAKTPMMVSDTVDLNDTERNLKIRIYEGERLAASKNKLLVELTLDISEVPAEDWASVQITFSIREDGVLRVEVVEPTNGKKNSMQVKDYMSQLPTQHDVERLIAEAKKFEAEDQEELECFPARKRLDKCCSFIKERLEKYKSSIPEAERKRMHEKCENEMKWIATNPNAKKEEIERRERELSEDYGKNTFPFFAAVSDDIVIANS